MKQVVSYDRVMDKERERDRYIGVAPPLAVPLRDLFAYECWLLFFNRSSRDCFLEHIQRFLKYPMSPK